MNPIKVYGVVGHTVFYLSIVAIFRASYCKKNKKKGYRSWALPHHVILCVMLLMPRRCFAACYFSCLLFYVCIYCYTFEYLWEKYHWSLVLIICLIQSPKPFPFYIIRNGGAYTYVSHLKSQTFSISQKLGTAKMKMNK